jgi:serine phosphatase RsbU (regulator of sigma subunit)
VINAWYGLSRAFIGVSGDSVGKYTRTGYNLAKKKNQKKLIVKGDIILSEYHMYKTSIDSVEYYAAEGCRLAKEINDKSYYAKCISIYQKIYSRKDIKDSLDKYTALTVKAWKEAGDTAKLINALIWTNHCYRNSGHIEEALKYTMLALKYSEYLKDSTLLGDANWCMAVLQRLKNDFKTELKYVNTCIQYLGNRNDSRRRQDYYTEKVIIFRNLNMIDSVINAELQGLNFNRSIGDSVNVFHSMISLADVYIEKQDFNKAESYIEQAEKAGVRGEDRDKYIIERSYYQLYKAKGEEERTALHLKVMISEVKKMKAPDVSVYASMSDICFDEKLFSEAKYFLDKCYNDFVSIGIKDVYNRMNLQYAVIFSELGNYKEAYSYLWKYTTINDSIYTEESNKSIAELEGKFQNEKKELEIKNLKNEKSLQDSEIQRQNTQKIFFAIGFIFVLIFAGFAYKAYVSKKKDNKIITLQKHLVEEKQKEIVDSINYAKKLQDAILPPLSLVKQFLPESFVLYKPKDIVAGDFYWMHTINKDHVLVAAADCTGHGVPGAMVSVVCSNALDRTVKEFGITEPGKILDKVRELVIETFQKSESEVKDGMDISLCSIKRKNGKVLIDWAGANNPLLYFSNGELKEITANKQPIGKYADEKPFISHTIELQANDILYLITDGYADQFGGPQGKKFKYKQLKEMLKELNQYPISQQHAKLSKAFDDWKANLEQVDDVCIVGIRI